MRRSAVVFGAFWLVSALFLGIGAIAANPADDEHTFVGRMSDERVAAGLPDYTVAPDLVEVARRHAEEMRRQQRLHHNPRLGEDVQGWQAVGENVGVGPTVEAIHQELMASPPHRANILSSRYTEVGVGVVADGDDIWVVQVFRLPRSAEPTPTSQPANPPPPTEESNSAPDTRPPPAPAPAPAPGSVRAANASQPAPTARDAPAGPNTATTEATAGTTPAAVPIAPSGPDAALEEGRTSGEGFGSIPAASSSRAQVAGGQEVGSTPARQVTWPVGLAATMLLGVVAGILVHVSRTVLRPTVASERRASLLDVWELALAR